MSEDQAEQWHDTFIALLALMAWCCIAVTLWMLALKPYEMELKQPCTEQTK